MSRDWESVSAYFDGELDGMSDDEMQRLIDENPEAEEVLKRYRDLHDSLNLGIQSEPENEPNDIDLEASSQRTWHRIQARLAAFAEYDKAALPDARRRDRRIISLPVPLAAAATLLLVASFTMAVWLAARQAPPPSVAGQSGPVNVTIEVDDMTAEQLVKWLHQEDMLGDLTVSLPSAPEFRFMGEPALIKAEEYRPALERVP
jgi:hypothetical protein